MNIQYCDLCGTPMKESSYYLLYIHNPGFTMPNANNFDSMNEYYSAYYRYLMNIQKETKEICPTCKHVFDKIFEYRLQGLSRLAEECTNLFNLPPKEKKEKKNGKEKK